MTEVIHKVKLLDGPVVLPEGAEILHVHEQNGGLFMWYKFEKEKKSFSTRYICIFGTGHDIQIQDGKLIYIGTAHVGGLVLHVFENVNEVNVFVS